MASNHLTIPEPLETLTPIAEQILALVRTRKGVSFVELSREIEGFSGGDLQFELHGLKTSNIVLCTGLTPQAVQALDLLRPFIEPTPPACSSTSLTEPTLTSPSLNMCATIKNHTGCHAFLTPVKCPL